MTARPVLALCAAGAWRPADLEWLRAVAALAAIGQEVEVREIGPGRGLLASDDLPPEAQRTLDALAASGVRPSPAAASDLLPLLRRAGSVLLLPDPARPGAPPLLELTDAALAAVSPDDVLRRLLDAGQVLRA